ncbi:MAG: hypothetical protein ACP5IL_16790, partial [Syntrophobacteraceae bacterium]
IELVKSAISDWSTRANSGLERSGEFGHISYRVSFISFFAPSREPRSTTLIGREVVCPDVFKAIWEVQRLWEKVRLFPLNAPME